MNQRISHHLFIFTVGLIALLVDCSFIGDGFQYPSNQFLSPISPEGNNSNNAKQTQCKISAACMNDQDSASKNWSFSLDDMKRATDNCQCPIFKRIRYDDWHKVIARCCSNCMLHRHELVIKNNDNYRQFLQNYFHGALQREYERWKLPLDDHFHSTKFRSFWDSSYGESLSPVDEKVAKKCMLELAASTTDIECYTTFDEKLGKPSFVGYETMFWWLNELTSVEFGRFGTTVEKKRMIFSCGFTEVLASLGYSFDEIIKCYEAYDSLNEHLKRLASYLFEKPNTKGNHETKGEHFFDHASLNVMLAIFDGILSDKLDLENQTVEQNLYTIVSSKWLWPLMDREYLALSMLNRQSDSLDYLMMILMGSGVIHETRHLNEISDQSIELVATKKIGSKLSQEELTELEKKVIQKRDTELFEPTNDISDSESTTQRRMADEVDEDMGNVPGWDHPRHWGDSYLPEMERNLGKELLGVMNERSVHEKRRRRNERCVNRIMQSAPPKKCYYRNDVLDLQCYSLDEHRETSIENIKNQIDNENDEKPCVKFTVQIKYRCPKQSDEIIQKTHYIIINNEDEVESLLMCEPRLSNSPLIVEYDGDLYKFYKQIKKRINNMPPDCFFFPDYFESNEDVLRANIDEAISTHRSKTVEQVKNEAIALPSDGQQNDNGESFDQNNDKSDSNLQPKPQPLTKLPKPVAKKIPTAVKVTVPAALTAILVPSTALSLSALITKLIHKKRPPLSANSEFSLDDDKLCCSINIEDLYRQKIRGPISRITVQFNYEEKQIDIKYDELNLKIKHASSTKDRLLAAFNRRIKQSESIPIPREYWDVLSEDTNVSCNLVYQPNGNVVNMVYIHLTEGAQTTNSDDGTETTINDSTSGLIDTFNTLTI